MGIYVLPMPFYINEELFYEDITLTQEEFYENWQEMQILRLPNRLPDVMDMWDKALEEYDEVVHIPMSAGLSSSCETAIMLSQDYDGKVQVVNNHRDFCYAAKIGGRGEKACRCWKERGRELKNC